MSGSDGRNTTTDSSGASLNARFAAYMAANGPPRSGFNAALPGFREQADKYSAGSDTSAVAPGRTSVSNLAFGSSSEDGARPVPPTPLPRKWRNMKHMVCAYWLQGYCSWEEHECQYAHAHTGIRAEKPTPPARGCKYSPVLRQGLSSLTRCRSGNGRKEPSPCQEQAS